MFQVKTCCNGHFCFFSDKLWLNYIVFIIIKLTDHFTSLFC